MAQIAEDRVAHLMREFDRRGFLDSTAGEDLIVEMVEAGLRANPKLQERLEELYRYEDGIVHQSELDDLITLIKSLCSELGRPTPEGLEDMNLKKLTSVYTPLSQERREQKQRVAERVEREYGPLVRVKLERTVVAPQGLLKDAQQLCLADLTGDNPEAALEVNVDPRLSYEKVEPSLYERFIAPIEKDELNQ